MASLFGIASSLCISIPIMVLQFSLIQSTICPCHHGPLCPPPPFPDMMALFETTLDVSPTLRTMSRAIIDGLAHGASPEECDYRLLQSFDWNHFNSRLCLAGDDPNFDDFVFPSMGRNATGRPMSVGAPRRTMVPAPKSSDSSLAGVEVIPVPASDEEAVGVWFMTGSSQHELNSSGGAGAKPNSGLILSKQGTVVVIGVCCLVLVFAIALVIFIVHRLRSFPKPKYDSPQEETLRMRWLAGEQYPRDGVAFEERTPTNPPGHPVKRYL